MDRPALAWLFFLTYVAATTLLAVRGMKKTSSFSGFALGNGDLGPILIGVTLAAAIASTATFVINPGFVYADGLSALLHHGVAAYGGVLVGLVVLSGSFRQLGVRERALTLPHWVDLRYRSGFLRSYFALFNLLVAVTSVVLVVKGSALLLQPTLDVSYSASLVIIVAFVFSYILLGGTYAHVYTNAFRGTLMVGVALLIFASGLSLFSAEEGGGFLARLAALDPNLTKVVNPASALFNSWFGVFVAGFVVGIGLVARGHPRVLGPRLSSLGRGASGGGSHCRWDEHARWHPCLRLHHCRQRLVSWRSRPALPRRAHRGTEGDGRLEGQPMDSGRHGAYRVCHRPRPPSIGGHLRAAGDLWSGIRLACTHCLWRAPPSLRRPRGLGRRFGRVQCPLRYVRVGNARPGRRRQPDHHRRLRHPVGGRSRFGLLPNEIASVCLATLSCPQIERKETMNKKLPLILLAILAVSACGDDDDASGNGGSGLDLATSAQILAFLEGKTLLMEGADIPTEPNGFNENFDFGAQSQCYNRSTIAVTGGQFNVTSQLGTITNMMCDRDTVAGQAGPFVSTNVTVSNVMDNANCFDIDVAYTGFGQEGRARISADGQTVDMELFFMGQATGHRCANGAVGSSGITLNGMPFTGNAVQVYRVQ